MLIGARSPGEMTPEQKSVHDEIASGPRGGVPLPFLAMLDVPALATAIQEVGSRIRFSGQLSAEQREVAILATAAAFGSAYEWDYHLAIARSLGVPQPVLDLAATGVDQPGTPAVYGDIVGLCRTAVLERLIDPARLAGLVEALGRPAASEAVAIAGYYPMLALFLSAGGLDRPFEHNGAAVSV